jgi:predicted ATP-dependent serine protease
MKRIVKMKDVTFDASLFENYQSGTVLDNLLCSYKGLPKGVNYMIIGDPGVGKTTIILDLVSSIARQQPATRILFISAEMNEIDLAIYVQRYPKFGDINILFVEPDINDDTHHLQQIEEVLQQGWDIVAIDSFHELQGIVKEEENITMRQAENKLLSMIKRHNKGENDAHTNTTFLTIQQVTKRGAFIGTNRLKHMITAMMELRLDNPKNVYSDRYVVFSKHRRGDVGVKLYYSLSCTGDVYYDEQRYLQDMQLRALQSNVSSQLRDFATQFERLFNNEINQ